MQQTVATPASPPLLTSIVSGWDLKEGCNSNTIQFEDAIRIRNEEQRKYYTVCHASLDYARQHRNSHFRVGVRQHGKLCWIGFAWSGTNQSMDWLKEIAEHLVEDAWADFQEMEDIEVEIKWPEKFSKIREYRPCGMSAREMIEEAGIDWGIFHPALSGDRLSVLVTLNAWEQDDPPTGFGALEIRIAEKMGFQIGGVAIKKGEEPRIVKMLFVRQAIMDVAKGRRGISGDMDCPVCGSRLAYWVFPNRRIHAECSTADCVHWRE
jgi:hypothetical protein